MTPAIEAVAKMISEQFDYPWEHMPEEGQNKMRGIAEEIAAIVSPAWIDPNDKAQARYLPNIGERVLFSYKGRVYYGAHAGGSFKSGSHHYNTWACRWMPLPAAPQQ